MALGHGGIMSTASDELDRIIAERDGATAADGLADVVEEFIAFEGTADDYFASIIQLPTPLRELYAALIFNSNIGWDGLPFAICRYDHPEFMAVLRDGFRLLGEDGLLSHIERAREHLRSELSTALQSDTPNVTFDAEAPELSNAVYLAQRKAIMPKIGAYLKSNRERVLSAAGRLGAPSA
jgi:hypothetical protein